MCRMLLAASPGKIDPNPHLDALREIAKTSKEYQGHGWGCAWLDHASRWRLYHNILPIWEDAASFDSTTCFIAHARSAFRDEGIAVENNMPFTDGEKVFAFNGELRGVRIKADGRIGAEKIFNTIRRFDKGPALREAVERGVMVINRRTRHIRAMNFILAGRLGIHVCSQFSEDPDYFQLREGVWGDTRIVCSEPYDRPDISWKRLKNHRIFSYRLDGGLS
ncbi:MAG: hypothetical protein F4Z15_04970 [Gammaproteobacteria bacterium]|nr:hypothetical protein [Gammaproteobacteria bacterium]MYD75509.1 hypothetical protein [Gammaproteobacteria bacterium]MYJ52382.1 hypothetical protein [Gammaproteobacteria bacterium]